jgi:hypothetical protein
MAPPADYNAVMPITTLKALDEQTARDVKDDFYQRGWESPSLTWADILKKLAPCYDLVTDAGRPVNKAAAKILATCKREWARGQRDAKKK